jgi:PAS domain S-box-containing protein
MQPPRPPPDEAGRLDALERYRMLDTLPEQSLDDIAHLAAHICGTPIALISLVDDHRQWFKSSIGVSFAETPRDISFCGHAILQPDLFVVPDTALDERFADNPLVAGGPRVRFYAGASLLTTDGHALGTLCIMDHVPRELDAGQREALRVLSRQAMAQLELRRQARALLEGQATLNETGRIAKVGGWDFDPVTRRGTWTDEVARIHDLAPGDGFSLDMVLAFYVGSARRRIEEAVSQAVACGTPYELDLEIRTAAGEHKWVRTIARPVLEDGRVVKLRGTFQDVTDMKRAEQHIEHLNRVYAVLSDINQMIVREPDIEAMFEAACQIAVDKGRFRMAWVARVAAAGGLSIAAHAGATPDTVALLRTIARRERSCAFTSHALRTATHSVCNDIANDPRAAPWRVENSERGYRSMASLPLTGGGVVLGTFNLYSDEPGFFTADELRLLDELAADISFAIEIARREDERRQADDRHGRQRSALIGLTAHQEVEGHDVGTGLRRITEAAARTLGTARVSVWRYTSDRSAIECMDLFELAEGRHSSGMVLSVATHPAYFRTLAGIDVSAGDADPRTGEPDDGYFTTLDIQSMLDVPVRLGGAPAGVLCHEHIGSQRRWSADESTFAVAMADLVSLALARWEREQAEGALRQSEERFREMAAHINEVFWIMLPDRSRMLYVSPAYESISGRSCARLYAQPGTWFEAIHADDRERVAAAGLEQGGGYDETYRIARPDGTVRWLHDCAVPVRTASGDVRYIVGTARDVTRQRQLEEQLRQAQKMEAIGQLAGGVAHDFNNILTIIQGYGALLLTDDRTAAEAEEAAQQIVQAAERAANLTRQLLAFSRRQIIHPQLVDLNVVVTSLTRMLQRIVGEDVHLQLNLHPRPLTTRADAGMLDQVLMNLVVNARDAMPEGGQLVIDTSAATLTDDDARARSDAPAGRYVCLRVTDTGTGISPESLSHVFEPFFTTKELGHGTGLGLATVFGIVAQHGGSVAVDSSFGRGTTFTVYLPEVAAAAAPVVVKAPALGVRGGNETILLVEDEPVVRRLVRVVLERHGYRVLEAASGVQALRAWDEADGAIHLLVTDMVMPEGMSGWELAEQLRERNHTLRVIFTSGYSADFAGRGRHLVEGQNFIQKPSSPHKVLEVVRRCLDS